MMREKSVSKRIQALKDEAEKFGQDNFRAVVPPSVKTFRSSSPVFFKRESQGSDVPETPVASTDGIDSNTSRYERV